MGRPQGPLDRDGSPVHEFAFWLRDLRRSSGLTYEKLARDAHYATSTIQAAVAGERLPTLRVTLAFVRACGGDTELWRSYWIQVRRLLDRHVPPGIAGSAAPPWAQPSGAQPSRAMGRPPAGAGGDAAGGWFIESFSAVLRLNAHPVEAEERRRIVCTADGLTELVTSITVPRDPRDAAQGRGLEAELLYGGSLTGRRQPYDSYFQHVIGLPRPLRAGERHEYALRLRVPPGQRMSPHFVHVPYRRSDHFELRVRFDPCRLPNAVWAVRAAPPAVIYQREPPGERQELDRFGEAYACFQDLRPGLGYGICWRDRPGSARDSPGS